MMKLKQLLRPKYQSGFSKTFRVNSFTYISCFFLMTTGFLFALAFITLGKASQQWISQWGRHNEVTVFLANDLSAGEKTKINSQIRRHMPQSEVKFLSQSQTADWIAKDLEISNLPMSSVAEMLPTLFVIKGTFNDKSVTDLSEDLKSMAGVEDIRWGVSWLEKLKPVLATFNQVGWLVLAFLGLSIHFLISNVIFQMINTHKKEVQIRSLLGATTIEIQKPIYFHMMGIVIFCFVFSIAGYLLLQRWTLDGLGKSIQVLSGLELQFLTLQELGMMSLFILTLSAFSIRNNHKRFQMGTWQLE